VSIRWKQRRNDGHPVLALAMAVAAVTCLAGCGGFLGSPGGSSRAMSGGTAVVAGSPGAAATNGAVGSAPNGTGAGPSSGNGSSNNGPGQGSGSGSGAGSNREFCKHVLAQYTIITDWARGPGGPDRSKVYRDLYNEELAADAVAPAQLKGDVKARLKVLAAVANATPAGQPQATAAFGSPEYLAATVHEDTYLATSCGMVASPTP